MKLKVKKIIALMAAIAIMVCPASETMAADNEEIGPDEDIVSVEYVDYDIFEEEPLVDSDITPYSHVTYVIKNKRNTGETLGNILFTSDEGEPGINVGISRSKSISATCSIGITAIKSAVSKALGFNVSASYSVSASNSWTVPSVYNGKKVKYGYIVAKPVYDNYSFSVYIRSIHTKETFLQNGTAKKPRGRMRIEKRVKYK